jgi:hypothetical protein
VAPRPAGRSGPEEDAYRARVRAWVERTCAEQGIPAKLSNPAKIARVAELLSQGRQKARNRDSSKRL